MRRVAHLIDTTGPGGAETVFVDLVCASQTRGWESLPVVRGAGWVLDRLRQSGFDPTIITSHRRFDVGYLGRLRRFVLQHGVDLVHAHLSTTTLYSSVVGLLTGTPVLATFHGWSDLGSESFGTRWRHRLIRLGCHRVVFVSHALMDRALRQRGFRRRDGTVIWNGIDTDRFRPGRAPELRRTLGVPEDRVLVASVGNVRPAKDYATLLAAAERVEAASPGTARFVVAGERAPPLSDELEALRRAKGLTDVVRFLGFRGDIPDLLRASDVFVLSSAHEGFSLVTVQALATGLPVVATRCGGPEEILGEPAAGILVPAGDPKALSEAILGLLDDPETRRSWARRGRERAVEAFSRTRMVDAYEGLYEEALRRAPSRTEA